MQQGLKEEGYSVSVSQLCRWFDVPRRSFYYRATKSAPKVQEALAGPIKALIEQEPSFGYRTVAGLLEMNKNTVQRIFQLKGWQVRKRAWASAADSGAALGGDQAGSTLGHGPLSGLGRSRWLAVLGVGDRLPYP